MTWICSTIWSVCCLLSLSLKVQCHQPSSSTCLRHRHPTSRWKDRPGQNQGQNPKIQHHWLKNYFALNTSCSSGATSVLYIHFLILTLKRVLEVGTLLPVGTWANSGSKTKLHFPAFLAIRSGHSTVAYPVKWGWKGHTLFPDLVHKGLLCKPPPQPFPFWLVMKTMIFWVILEGTGWTWQKLYQPGSLTDCLWERNLLTHLSFFFFFKEKCIHWALGV